MGKVFLKGFLDVNPGLTYHHGLYYQRDLPLRSDFEKEYISLRRSEGRFYDDDVARNLPDIAESHPLYAEWRIRKKSTDRLVEYLRKRNPKTILEVGCGNGWLTRYLQKHLPAECCGVDVNETELKQAVALLKPHDFLSFVYADIYAPVFDSLTVDIIVLASVIQYFPDPGRLLTRLKSMLNAGGQIHVIDSPFYREGEIANARERSKKYFVDAGQRDMSTHYFHHSWDTMNGHSVKFMYDPSTAWNQLRAKLTRDSPFPWIVIEKE